MAATALVRPSNVTVIGVMSIVSGVTNIFASIGIFLTVLSIGIATLGIGCLLLPLSILPLVLGIFEIIYGVKVISNPPQPVQPGKTLAILQICTILYLNLISVVTGILALVFYNDSEVETYFSKLNS